MFVGNIIFPWFDSVVEPFPKISKEMLAKGIFNVKYRVHLDALKEFEITEEELYEQL